MKLVLFDVDGTLVRAPSMERRFFRWLLRRGRLGSRQLLAFLVFNLRWVLVHGRHTGRKNKAYLAGLTVEEVQIEADAFIERELEGALDRDCLERLREHLGNGDTVYLLTGTLTAIACAIARQLGIANVVATQCMVVDGYYTTAPPDVHPFAAEKCAAYDRILAEIAEAPVETFAYGDSIHDLALLTRVGHPVCVNPDDRLRRKAEDDRWEILDVPCAGG